MVNDETGERLSGDTSKPEHFTELWKLVRGRTGWVLDEIEQSAGIFSLSQLHLVAQETRFLDAPTNPIP